MLEGVNALVTAYFGNYLYFLLRDRFGFGNLGNLSVSAIGGLIYIVAAWQGGRFAQRFGYFTALKTGWLGMAVCLAVGAVFPSLPVLVAVVLGWNAAMCFTWPTLEALVSEGVDDAALPRNLGLYNVVWAAGSAVAYFFGGTLYERLGQNSLFWLPALVHAGQWIAVRRLGENPVPQPAPAPAASASDHHPEAAALRQSVGPETFLRMAWLAIPFSYIGINTVIAIIPDLARALGLSTAQAGLFCSLWMFVRLGTFAVLWRWTRWHYRFRWLLASFLGLMGSSAVLLLSHHLALLVAAQAVFGFSVGLIYYSSLFYSMDVGETKGEHGGLHEAMIGTGICLGPAVGAASLYFVPGSPNAGGNAVVALLACGLAALLTVHRRGRGGRGRGGG